MIQEVTRVDMSVHKSGAVALAPGRDLVVMLPVWVMKAIRLGALNEPVVPEKLHNFVVRLDNFFRDAVDSSQTQKVSELCEQLKLFHMSKEEEDFVARWLFRQLLGSYYGGVRASTKVGDEPVRVVDLLQDVEVPGQRKGWVQRLIQWVLR